MPHTISLRFLEFYPGLQTFVDDSTLPPKTAGKTPVTGPLLSITLLDASCLSANVFGAVVCPNWDFSPCFLLGTVKVAPDPRTAYRGACAYPCLSRWRLRPTSLIYIEWYLSCAGLFPSAGGGMGTTTGDFDISGPPLAPRVHCRRNRSAGARGLITWLDVPC